MSLDETLAYSIHNRIRAHTMKRFECEFGHVIGKQLQCELSKITGDGCNKKLNCDILQITDRFHTEVRSIIFNY